MKFSKVFPSILIIVICALTFLLFYVIKTDKELLLAQEAASNDKINMQLISHIGLAQSSFGVDFLAQTDIDFRNNLFEHSIADVAMVFALSEVSSIEDSNDLIDVAFGGLYKAMLDPKYKMQIMKDQKKIYEMLTNIAMDPYNKSSTKELYDYLGRIQK